MNTAPEIIEEALKRLGAAFGREFKSRMLNLWIDLFSAYPPEVLLAAFREIERKEEKFPVPATIFRHLREHYRSDSWIRYRHEPVIDAEGIPCWRAVKLGPLGVPERDGEGKLCYELLYRFADIPEGRAFLAKLAEVADKLDLAKWYREGMAGPEPK